MKSTVDDDQWALRRLKEGHIDEFGTYRYADPVGVVHRAIWRSSKWSACCGVSVVEKLQENDAGAVTCVRCLWAGA
jgi:hypothetical protein